MCESVVKKKKRHVQTLRVRTRRACPWAVGAARTEALPAASERSPNSNGHVIGMLGNPAGRRKKKAFNAHGI